MFSYFRSRICMIMQLNKKILLLLIPDGLSWTRPPCTPLNSPSLERNISKTKILYGTQYIPTEWVTHISRRCLMAVQNDWKRQKLIRATDVRIYTKTNSFEAGGTPEMRPSQFARYTPHPPPKKNTSNTEHLPELYSPEINLLFRWIQMESLTRLFL